MSMIIRTPTRTKTKSFKGEQMGFKFPSNENLPKIVTSPKNEYDLNNHHLLNDNLALHDNNSNEDDNLSQIKSDYTFSTNTNSNTNTNTYSSSSNGYYSFANISDNTTTSPKLFPVSNTSNSHSKHLAAEKLPPSSISYFSSSSPSFKKYVSTNPSVSTNCTTDVTKRSTLYSIPTADNISYAIVSATSSESSSIDKLSTNNINRNHSSASSNTSTFSSTSYHSLSKEQTNLRRVPTIKQVPSISSNGTLSSPTKKSSKKKISQIQSPKKVKQKLSSPTTAISPSQKKTLPKSHHTTTKTRNPTSKSSKSSLKRSNAIRCKGGLLYYFTMIGIKLKKTLKKLRFMIRSKLFNKNKNKNKNKKYVSSTSNMKSNIKSPLINTKKTTNKNIQLKTHSRVSTNKNFSPETSHLKRTNGYVTNLQKRSSSITPSPSIKNINKIISSPTSPIIQNPITNRNNNNTTSLRRTASSIRRAASTLHSSTATPSHSIITSPRLNQQQQITRNNTTQSRFIRNRTNIATTTPQLSSSASLNSNVIRQPSIVVKNKVIPLSSHHQHNTIHEEPDNEQDEDEYDDEYIIDINSMNVLSEIEEDNNSDSGMEDSKEQLQDVIGQYLRYVITKRIMLRYQISKFEQEQTYSSSSNTVMSPLLYGIQEESEEEEEEEEEEEDDFVSIMSSSNGSQLMENETDESDTEELDEKLNYHHQVSTTNFNTLPPLTTMNNVFHNVSMSSSLLSVPVTTVKRSLTLPVGMKI
ncbi:Aim44p NDAI_0K01330 [Naumovozyma dairenensis CBS 421]|uniref:Altered inheritance of mitochondria protein 44 n=1 Tax=Naumovozyma dairenensis (strain ATCC 10597 / BCRC 20456 / CBS 421 / NBRC 0211 / NRRL Y-12639) TaxID=1071378 RepID=G0WHR3_NAUDC|nr:hypothetical protein NDAI_0K01330 [Naumovozyma dairenensis CBS 421]CCD27324.1 hypothetical protein NDAI_0K01330 [Naumovozyma dairenensis CBS 421]